MTPDTNPVPTPAAARISIVVPTRNRAGILTGCLESLLEQDADPATYEVIVVDNGSTDGTSKVVEELAASSGRSIAVVDAPVAGVNRARNAGIRAARGGVVTFIDDDERAPADYVAKLLRSLTDNPAATGVGGPVVDQPGNARTCGSCGLGAAEVPVAADGSAPRLLGGNMALRTTAFDAVGLFDERLSGRGDETEWFDRASAAGLRFHYDQDLWLEHRRDVFSAWQLVRLQLKQGQARPLADAAMGQAFRPRPMRVLRGVGHGLTRRCVHGWLLAARELGAISGSIKHPSTLRRRDRREEP
jgi:glycosyltransferase involved in cell wall biosynthesis